MSYDRHPQFTFGPRHRIVRQARRPSWLWPILTILTFAGWGVLLALMIGAGPAHAEDYRAKVERLNSECRSYPDARAACAERDRMLADLKARGVCWNARSATPADLWISCVQRPVWQAPATAGQSTAEKNALIERSLARCAQQGMIYDQVTEWRNKGAPLRIVLSWNLYPADIVQAIYSGRISSYGAQAACYSLENIERERRAVGLL